MKIQSKHKLRLAQWRGRVREVMALAGMVDRAEGDALVRLRVRLKAACERMDALAVPPGYRSWEHLDAEIERQDAA